MTKRIIEFSFIFSVIIYLFLGNYLNKTIKLSYPLTKDISTYLYISSFIILFTSIFVSRLKFLQSMIIALNNSRNTINFRSFISFSFWQIGFFTENCRYLNYCNVLYYFFKRRNT